MRVPRRRRLARALGFEPVFLAVLATGVPLAALVHEATARPTPVVSSPAAPLLAVPPPLETFYLFPIKIRNGVPTGGIQRLEVAQGDEVTIGILTDHQTIVSVEGYDVWAPLLAGDEGMIDLVAQQWGQFPVKANGQLVGMLSVRPSWAGPPAAD